MEYKDINDVPFIVFEPIQINTEILIGEFGVVVDLMTSANRSNEIFTPKNILVGYYNNVFEPVFNVVSEYQVEKLIGVTKDQKVLQHLLIKSFNKTKLSLL